MPLIYCTLEGLCDPHTNKPKNVAINTDFVASITQVLAVKPKIITSINMSNGVNVVVREEYKEVCKLFNEATNPDKNHVSAPVDIFEKQSVPSP